MPRHQNSLFVFLVCALLAADWTIACQAGAVSPPIEEAAVFVQNHTVCVTLKNAQLGEVIERIAKLEHLKVWVSPKVTGERLTEQFTDLPLDKALHRLLRGMNYALLFNRADSKDAVSGIYVLSPGGPVQPDSAPPPSLNNAELHAYIQAQDPDFFPAGVREALLELTERDKKLEEEAKEQRGEAVARLIELLKNASHGESNTTRQLEEYLRHQP